MAGANGYFPAKHYNIEKYERAALEYHAVNLILSIILFLVAAKPNIAADFSLRATANFAYS
jgi:heme/copper-type cytochrome/quinol oxidase subunit 4